VLCGWVARDDLRLAAQALRRAVPFLAVRVVPVNLRQRCVVDVSAEGILDGGQVGLVAVRGELHTATETAGNVGHELVRRARVARTNKPRWDQLRVRIDARPRPDGAQTDSPLLV